MSILVLIAFLSLLLILISLVGIAASIWCSASLSGRLCFNSHYRRWFNEVYIAYEFCWDYLRRLSG